MQKYQVYLKETEKSEWEKHLPPFAIRISAEHLAYSKVKMQEAYQAKVVDITTEKIVLEV